MANTDVDAQNDPQPYKPNSIENPVPTVTTTSGQAVPVVSVLDATLLNETYQRINGARFSR